MIMGPRTSYNKGGRTWGIVSSANRLRSVLEERRLGRLGGSAQQALARRFRFKMEAFPGFFIFGVLVALYATLYTAARSLRYR